jgi:hypothetical protein
MKSHGPQPIISIALSMGLLACPDIRDREEFSTEGVTEFEIVGFQSVNIALLREDSDDLTGRAFSTDLDQVVIARQSTSLRLDASAVSDATANMSVEAVRSIRIIRSRVDFDARESELGWVTAEDSQVSMGASFNAPNEAPIPLTIRATGSFVSTDSTRRPGCSDLVLEADATTVNLRLGACPEITLTGNEAGLALGGRAARLSASLVNSIILAPALETSTASLNLRGTEAFLCADRIEGSLREGSTLEYRCDPELDLDIDASSSAAPR